MSHPAGRIKPAIAAAAFVAAVGIGLGSTAISAASAPPPPTISSSPSNPTSSTTATFAFTDTQKTATYQCAFDAGTLVACASPKTYSTLADGTHTFHVVAQVGGGQISNATTFSWLVDTSPPAIAVSFPANNGTYNTSGWNSGCPVSPGICGTASDPSGVSVVQVSILQLSSGKYWNNNAGKFAPSAELFYPATGTTIWRFPLAMQTDGYYVLHVQATDTLGHTTTQYVTVNYRLKTTLPPPPVITNHPASLTTSPDATFDYTDAEAGDTFQCSVDSSPFAACGNGEAQYHNLSVSGHTFAVRAVDAASNTSSPASFSWTIGASAPFGISGNLSSSLYPGATVPLNLSLTNPYSWPISVLTVTITVAPGTTKNNVANPSCDGPTNVVVSQTFSGPVTIPANSTKSLQDLGIAQSQWPQVTMKDLGSNQDACKGTRFFFSYSGTATEG
jgi:hypothetical protein